MTQPSVNNEGTLSRELADFLVEFSIALHKNAIYPPGHPLLDSAVVSVTIRLQTLLRERGTISLGVARHQLVIEGVATDPSHPLLRELAQRLHRHHLGAVRFIDGVTQDEVSQSLVTLGTDPSRMDRALGLGPPEALLRWEHVKLFALTYEQLELMGDEEGAPTGGGGTRAAQLWVGLARAALQAEAEGAATPGDAVAEESPQNDPAVVAKAIDEHQRDIAYDQVIVGYLLQIADELKSKRGQEAIALQKRISRMVGSLKPETLRRLLNMGGDVTQRRKFVLDASDGMAVDAVVELLQAAADTSHQTISHSMVRLLNKLAVHAEKGTERARPVADAALRDNVKRLIGKWSLDDPNPDAYLKVLEGMSRASPSLQPEATDRDCEPERLVQIAFEIGGFGPTVTRAVDRLMDEGRFGFLFDTMASAPDMHQELQDYILTVDHFRAFLLRDPVDLAVAGRAAARLGLAAVDPLLDLLETSEGTGDRLPRALVDLLASLGSEASEPAVRRLSGNKPGVQRRLLMLMGKLPTWPEGFSPVEYSTHSDQGVRREGIALMLTRDDLRERGVRLALVDIDERTIRLGLGAVTAELAGIAVPAILRRLQERTFPPELRVLAIRVLAASRSRAALEFMLQGTLKKRLLFGYGLTAKSPEMIAMVAGLAGHWRDEPRVGTVVGLAARSQDTEIRAAVTQSRSP